MWRWKPIIWTLHFLFLFFFIFAVVARDMFQQNTYKQRPNNAHRVPKKTRRVKARIWKAKKTQSNDAQCSFLSVVCSLASTFSVFTFRCNHYWLSKMPVVLPFFRLLLLRLFVCLFAKCWAYAFLVLFFLLLLFGNKNQCCWQPHSPTWNSPNWTSTQKTQSKCELQAEEEKNVNLLLHELK